MRLLLLSLSLFFAAGCDSADPYAPVECEDGELVVEDLVVGNGAAARSTSQVVVNYRGTFPDGTEFDSGSGVQFSLQGVVPGFRQGVTGMRAPGGQEGQAGKRRITVPPNLGYGGFPRSGIPACSTLLFEVELLDVVG